MSLGELASITNTPQDTDLTLIRHTTILEDTTLLGSRIQKSGALESMSVLRVLHGVKNYLFGSERSL